MAQQPFFWGRNGQAMTPEQVARERELAQLASERAGDTSPVGHWSAGAARVVDALGGVLRDRRADRAEQAGLAAAQYRYDPVVQAILGGGAVSPEMAGSAIDMQSDPWARERYGPVMRAIMAGMPKYRLGTGYHPGGPAIVGEDGPEIAWLPEGAAVMPNPATGLGADYDRELDAMTPNERAIILRKLNEGAAPADAFAPSGYDPREMLMEQGALGQPYRVAEADTVKSDALPYGDTKLTEAQSKDVGYFTRGIAANTALSDPQMEQSLTQLSDSFAGNFGALGRMFQDAEYQKAKRAADEFLAVILRKDTGAAITAEEFRMYAPMYLPLPGDKPEVIEAKRKAREIALTGIEMGLGTAGRLGQIAKEKYGPQEMSDEEFLKTLGFE